TAFYYTIVTLATVGYGDIVPKTAETRLFAETLIIVGLSIFATALASTLGPALSGQLAHIFGAEKETMKFKNHVILVGEGHFAENTARELTHRGVQFVRVVSLGNDLSASDGTVVKGDPQDDALLREAGIADSRMLIAARDDDGANAFITLLAKDLNPDVSVLAVANSVRSIRPLETGPRRRRLCAGRSGRAIIGRPRGRRRNTQRFSRPALRAIKPSSRLCDDGHDDNRRQQEQNQRRIVHADQTPTVLRLRTAPLCNRRKQSPCDRGSARTPRVLT
ncbi:MAG: NAD-binding protein, partial [Candidatus Eremiobacteraeota bacterium]|nr:NAD-binding protein [Candidatus Eremiobacteraeota bacterium]